MITAGLPSTRRHPDDVYRLTYAQTEARNAEFFARYPADEETCWAIVEHLADAAAAGSRTLADGRGAECASFPDVGTNLGRSYGLESLHYPLENPFVERRGGKRLSSRFLHAVGAELSYGPNPLYWAPPRVDLPAAGIVPAWSAGSRARAVPAVPPARTQRRRRERALRAEGYGFRFTVSTSSSGRARGSGFYAAGAGC